MGERATCQETTCECMNKPWWSRERARRLCIITQQAVAEFERRLNEHSPKPKEG